MGVKLGDWEKKERAGSGGRLTLQHFQVLKSMLFLSGVIGTGIGVVITPDSEVWIVLC
jgi:hypothetical protein